MKRQFLALACLMAAASLVAACGSSSKSSSSTPAATTPTTSGPGTTASATSAPAAAPTGAPIKLGAVSSCGGPLSSSLGAACPTITAWADWVNAHGGINGHPVQMTVLDDEGNPTTSLLDLKKLIQGDHVMAIVGEFSVDDPTWISYIASSGVPVVGGATSEVPFSISPDFYPSGGQIPPYLYAEAASVKQHGATKLGTIVCAEAPVCATNPVITAAMIKNGLLPGQKLVYTTKIAATQPSFTAECLAAKSSGAQAVLISDAGAITQRVVDQCAQQGYKPIFMAGGGVYNPVLAKDPNFNGAIETDSNPPLSDTALPATDTMLTAMKKYAPSVSSSSDQWNQTIPNVWSGGLLFQAAAKAGDLGPNSTPAEVKDALYKLKGTTLGGYSPAPLTFKKGVITQAPCVFIETVTGGKLVPASFGGTKPICIPGNSSKYLSLLG